MLDAIGHSLSDPYGYEYSYNPHRGFGIDLGGLISSFIPRVDVRVRKPGSYGCSGSGCGSGSNIEVNVGSRRKCPDADGCGINQPRPLPPPPSQPESEPCREGSACPEKDIDIEIPFTGIRVGIRKNGVSPDTPSSSNPCPTCGGSSSNKPKVKPVVPSNNRPRCPAGQVFYLSARYYYSNFFIPSLQFSPLFISPLHFLSPPFDFSFPSLAHSLFPISLLQFSIFPSL